MEYDLSKEEDRSALRFEVNRLMVTRPIVRLERIKAKVKKRTLTQNAALHVLFEQLAEKLNEAGFDMKRTLRSDAEIPWNADLVKEHLWRKVQQAQTGKESTTELSTKEIDEVFDTLNRHLGTVTGISLNFPSIETLLLDKR